MEARREGHRFSQYPCTSHQTGWLVVAWRRTSQDCACALAHHTVGHAHGGSGRALGARLLQELAAGEHRLEPEMVPRQLQHRIQEARVRLAVQLRGGARRSGGAPACALSREAGQGVPGSLQRPRRCEQRRWQADSPPWGRALRARVHPPCGAARLIAAGRHVQRHVPAEAQQDVVQDWQDGRGIARAQPALQTSSAR